MRGSHGRPTLLEVKGLALRLILGGVVCGGSGALGALGWVWLETAGDNSCAFGLEVLGSSGCVEPTLPGPGPRPGSSCGDGGTFGDLGAFAQGVAVEWQSSSGAVVVLGTPQPGPSQGLPVLGLLLKRPQFAVMRGLARAGVCAAPPGPRALQSLQPQLLLLEPAGAARAKSRVLLHQP